MLDVKELKTEFAVRDKTVKAVDGVSFSVKEKQIVGIVGESGSGKSVTSLSIMGILAPNASITNGEILWNGDDLLKKSESERRRYRGSEIGLIFQNPMGALNPVFSIGDQMIETILRHHDITKEAARDMAIDLLQKVNIPDAKNRLTDYPHQFSLGMCQRVMIAITLAMSPKLLIADEPTASLDVTIQAQILTLLKELRDTHDMSILIISHDLGVMAQHCDEILVMYLGKIVEKGSPKDIFKSPKHPYTQALISSIPSTNPDEKHQPTLLKGDIPSPLNIPTGCRFHTRCPIATEKCRKEEPKLCGKDGRDVACFFAT